MLTSIKRHLARRISPDTYVEDVGSSENATHVVVPIEEYCRLMHIKSLAATFAWNSSMAARLAIADVADPEYTTAAANAMTELLIELADRH